MTSRTVTITMSVDEFRALRDEYKHAASFTDTLAYKHELVEFMASIDRARGGHHYTPAARAIEGTKPT